MLSLAYYDILENISYSQTVHQDNYSLYLRRHEIEKTFYSEKSTGSISLDCPNPIPLSIRYFYNLQEFAINKTTCKLCEPGSGASFFKVNAKSWNMTYLTGHDDFKINFTVVNDIDSSWKRVGNNIEANVSLSNNNLPKSILLPNKQKIRIPISKHENFTIKGIGFPTSRIDRGDLIFRYNIKPETSKA